MWYFAWLLGLPLAAAFAVLNGMWFELTEDRMVRRALMQDIASTPNPGEDAG